MSRPTIGVVDYGVGNLSSVRASLHAIGYRCRESGDKAVLEKTDALLLPGVGAFAPAMDALLAADLCQYIQAVAQRGKPVIGICLGMQLLADSSTENGNRVGLGLVPGQVQALSQGNWHIGWNNIEVITDDPLLKVADGRSVYFNHSYVFHAPREYQTAVARLDGMTDPFPVAVRRNNVLGLQFHPEKSQGAGRAILASLIEGLCNA